MKGKKVVVVSGGFDPIHIGHIRHLRGPREQRHMEDECFGLPDGGAIVGIIFGLIVVVVGLSILYKVDIWDLLWPLAIIVLGVLLIGGALYGMRRSSSRGLTAPS